MSTGNNLFWSSRLFLFCEQCKVMRRFYTASVRFAALDLWMSCLYLFSNPYRMCRRHFKKAGEQNIHLYGETPLTVWKVMAELSEFKETDRFVDLGSGRGRLCFWTHLWFGCQTTGVDWVPQFINKAQKLAALFRLIGVRFVSDRISDADLGDATVVYLYTFHPDEEIIDFKKLATDARVITVSEPIAREGFMVHKSCQAQFPWGPADIYINKKL
ncbi:MAG: hypothetical protein HW387_914 [Parachlamydiales bacterium]|nr:hypothetical protein [Parachlamydiales bacterium]